MCNKGILINSSASDSWMSALSDTHSSVERKSKTIRWEKGSKIFQTFEWRTDAQELGIGIIIYAMLVKLSTCKARSSTTWYSMEYSIDIGRFGNNKTNLTPDGKLWVVICEYHGENWFCSMFPYSEIRHICTWKDDFVWAEVTYIVIHLIFIAKCKKVDPLGYRHPCHWTHDSNWVTGPIVCSE